MKQNTIESQLFDWDGWDELDVGDIAFYDVTFKVPVGPYQPGDNAPTVALLLQSSTIAIYDGGGEEVFTSPVSLTIAKKEFFVLIEPWAVYVKEGEFFRQSGGMEEQWGSRWEPVYAESNEEARQIGENMRDERT